jgi:hypothetical protein
MMGSGCCAGGKDDLWGDKIREAMDSVREQFGMEPISGRLVRQYSPFESEEAAFEIATTEGPVLAVRHRDGSLIIHLQNRNL